MNVEQLLKITGASPNKRVILNVFQDTNDIQKAVIQQHNLNREDAAKIAKYFDANTDYEVCQKLWQFVHYKLNYKAEAETQKVKSMRAILTDALNKTGNDCKHYSGFIGAILEQLEIPFVYRFVSYPDPEGIIPDNLMNVSHVYIVVPGLCKVDAVLPYFDSEQPYIKKIDLPVTKKKKICLYV